MENEIQQHLPSTQPLPQVPTPVSPSIHWSTIILFILLGLVVIVVSVFVGIQIGKKQIPDQQPVVVKPTTIPTQVAISPTIQSTINSTENWKTFIQKDAIMPISFKYPSNLVVSIRTGKRPVIVIDTKQSDIPEMFDSPIAPIEIMLDLNSNPYIKAIENKRELFIESTFKMEKLNNNGIVGTLFSGTVAPGMRSGRFVEAYFDNGINPAIIFWYEGYSEEYKKTSISEDVFTQIVKTVSLVK